MRLQPVVLLTLLSCAAPAALAQSASAQSAPESTASDTARQPLDANQDGIITREEAQTHPGVAKHFDQIDSNRDGKIDSSELRTAQDRMKSRREQKQAQQAAAAEASSSD